MTSSDDEDVKRAIALSLGQRDPVDTPSLEMIDLTSEEPTSVPTQPPDLSGIPGLNRAQMEQERLARKRKAEGQISPPPSHAIPNEPSKNSGLPASGDAPRKAARMGVHIVERQDLLHFPTGVVKKTWAKGQPRLGDDIKIEEVLQPAKLRMAVLSSFQWDVPWLFSKLRGQRSMGSDGVAGLDVGDGYENANKNVKVVMVMQAKDEETKGQYRKETEGVGNLRLCFPSMAGGVNCMHSKLMVLSYQNSLRLAIPTANLVPYDWGETGTTENCVWLIDLPRMKDRQRIPRSDLAPFGSELLHFLEAKGLDQNIVNSLCNFDFSDTEDVAFVHTIGGSHTGQSWQQTGYPGLSRTIASLNLSTQRTLEIDFVTSSIGSLNLAFLSNIYRACQGADFSEDINRKAKTHKAPLQKPNRVQDEFKEDIEERFRIYFPTHETVTSSIAGHAGTICMRSSYYNNPAFPQNLLRECKSVRKGMLMHNKILFVRPAEEGNGSNNITNRAHSWAYIGSANCSESAWGNKLVKERGTGMTKIFCRNWECGVVVKCNTDVGSKIDGLGIFEGTVPVPMEWPGEKYDGRKPWFFMEHV